MQNLVLDGEKLAFHKERVDALLRGERVAPVSIECALTRKCNYSCIFCDAINQKHYATQDTSRTAFLNFLDDAAMIGVKGISFIGDGENTCSPFFSEAIIHGKSLGIDIAVGTNGYLLDDVFFASAFEKLTYLRFSICAATPERYAYIHGVSEKTFTQVCHNIKRCVAIKRNKKLKTTIGLQMVLMPDFADQVLPLVKLGSELGVDYTVIKHCGDGVEGKLNVQYDQYDALHHLLHEAEAFSTPEYLVKVKWKKILAGKQRSYTKCYGAVLYPQISGSGLLAPCGYLFDEELYKEYYIGNINETRFKQLWESDKYWAVMAKLIDDSFNAQTVCGFLCMQDYINRTLWDMKYNNAKLPSDAAQPEHINFL